MCCFRSIDPARWVRQTIPVFALVLCYALLAGCGGSDAQASADPEPTATVEAATPTPEPEPTAEPEPTPSVPSMTSLTASRVDRCLEGYEELHEAVVDYPLESDGRVMLLGVTGDNLNAARDYCLDAVERVVADIGDGVEAARLVAILEVLERASDAASCDMFCDLAAGSPVLDAVIELGGVDE